MARAETGALVGLWYRSILGPDGDIHEVLTLPAAVALITAGPARAAGLSDRGRLIPGFRADLVLAAVVADRPHVRATARTEAAQ